MSGQGRIHHIDGAFYAISKDRPPVRVARVVSECSCQGVGEQCHRCLEGISTAWVPVARLREARAC